ncbi:hypothetical protein RIF29_37787 [Crotalaria pallida]|uniref:FLZ-type domain-containing protein n=1 Tax=Crotalaria pallida TaxID=3830 RepID=A0AAN9DYT1_CROPI
MMMMFMRNRTSRAVSNPLMVADHSSSQQSTNQTYAARTILSSLFGSPKFMELINNHSFSGAATEAMMRSPTSVLDSKALSSSPFGFGINPFFSYGNNNKSSPQSKSFIIDKIESQGIGLALVCALNEIEESFDEKNSGDGSMKGSVLFGTQLRLKIKDSKKSGDFDSMIREEAVEEAAGVDGDQTLSEMELSEEYTCVISHLGPYPKTTHIFNNCIVEQNYFSVPQKSHYYYASASFLSFCYTCKKHLHQKMDIFIYKGEKAFCSPECRYTEIELDGGLDSGSESDSD